MILDLSQIRRRETDVARHYEASAFAGSSAEFRVIEAVDLRFTVFKDGDRFRLTGTVASLLELDCSRCLEAFRLPVDATFDLRYLPQSANTGEEREVADEHLSDAFYRDDVIDLRQLVEEQFYLALPMKPLCRDDCRGLCPACGANLNTGACECRVRWEDPRLAGPKTLRSWDKDHA
jgi:uncharacterized protein